MSTKIVDTIAADVAASARGKNYVRPIGCRIYKRQAPCNERRGGGGDRVYTGNEAG